MSKQDEHDGAAAGEPDVGRGLLDEQMGPSSAMAHLYRGELHRMTRWRERLDRTANWAVTVMAAILTWAFSSPNNPHYVILVGGIMLAIFLSIEARRYRGYDMWRSRVRVLQENLWALGLDPSSGVETPDWRERLSEDYHNPRMRISYEEAIAHRLRRIYLPLFTVLFGAWLFKVVFVVTDATWPTSASIGMLSGVLVTGLVVLGYVGLLLVTFRPRRWKAKGELRHEEEVQPWEEYE
jgi:uncharacterized membrane protein